MIKITSAMEEGIPRILEIEQASISPPWTHGALLSEIYRDDSLFALAVEDNVVIGFCILRRMADEGELLQIAVDALARRRGVGDLLMKAALDFARAIPLRAVYLEVRAGNDAAIALYKTHGFTRTGARKDYYTQPVEDAVIMTREI